MSYLKGDTTSCLKDLASRFSIDKGLLELARFCEVAPGSALLWIHDGKLPQGLTLLKLRVFLELHCYEVTEYRDLPRLTRHFAQLLAFNVISTEAAKDVLEYADTTAVYRIVLQGTGLTTERVYKLQKLVETNEEARLSALRRFREEFAHEQKAVDPQPEDSSVPQTEETAEAVAQPVEMPTPLAIRLLEQHLQSAAMLVEFLDSHHDDWPTSYFQLPAYNLGKARLTSLADTMSDALEQL